MTEGLGSSVGGARRGSDRQGRRGVDGLTRPCAEVTLSCEFDDLSPAVGAAIYRLAQESITNARRHARHATQVTVAVTCDADRVRLTCGGSQGLEGG